MEDRSTQNEIIVQEGTKIEGTYVVEKFIGSGHFGEVFKVRHAKQGNSMAMKMSKKVEYNALFDKEIESLNLTKGAKFLPMYIASGYFQQRKFVLMTLFSKDLDDCISRKGRSRGLNFKLATKIASSMLDPIEELHSFGLIHRDIKLANFAFRRVSQNERLQIALLDLGLCKKFMDENQQLLPRQRGNVHFVGTKIYASVRQMQTLDTSRRDDMQSWLYCIVELFGRELPWMYAFVDSEILARKKTTAFERLIERIHPLLVECQNHISSLRFETKPDYDKLRDLLKQMLPQEDREVGMFLDDLFEK